MKKTATATIPNRFSEKSPTAKASPPRLAFGKANQSGSPVRPGISRSPTNKTSPKLKVITEKNNPLRTSATAKSPRNIPPVSPGSPLSRQKSPRQFMFTRQNSMGNLNQGLKSPASPRAGGKLNEDAKDKEIFNMKQKMLVLLRENTKLKKELEDIKTVPFD